jgi:AcrR family transcriptional regulator
MYTYSMRAGVAATPNRQTRKRLATRQKISDVASRLFFQRGFDQVTIEEIAEAADVSRMTVFNHFSRKEDLLFDLDDEGREDVLAALQQRDSETSPVEALRLFAHWAVANQRPYVRFYESGTDKFMATIQASEALKSRARAIRDELTDTLTVGLAESANCPSPDATASLAASLLVATWTVALLESHRVFQSNPDIKEANTVFLGLIDRGTKGVQAALEGTPYI